MLAPKALLVPLLVLATPLALLAACSSDDDAADVTAPTTTTTLTPEQVLAHCTPAPSEDFVAIEHRHLTNGAHHLGQGFAVDQPDGHYVIADVYSIDDQLLASGLIWRLQGAGGAAFSATPETSVFDNLPDVPAGQSNPPQSLRDCLAAANATG